MKVEISRASIETEEIVYTAQGGNELALEKEGAIGWRQTTTTKGRQKVTFYYMWGWLSVEEWAELRQGPLNRIAP